MPGIGTLNEKHLHKALKNLYARPGDRKEVRVGRYVVDIFRDDELIEIQTRNFSSIKAKIDKLTEKNNVRLVYPIAKEKYILKPNCKKRRSPKTGRVEEVFKEMVYAPQLIKKGNFSLEVVLTKEEETRKMGKRRWRKAWVTEDRRLLEVMETHLFKDPKDWQKLLPESLGETFTTKDMAEAIGIRMYLIHKMAYCLKKAGLIELVGKQGRANLYQITPSD